MRCVRVALQRNSGRVVPVAHELGRNRCNTRVKDKTKINFLLQPEHILKRPCDAYAFAISKPLSIQHDDHLFNAYASPYPL